MTEKEKQLIRQHLPSDFDWDLVKYTLMGNFSQLLYDGDLVGYIMHDGPEPMFKGSIMKK